MWGSIGAVAALGIALVVVFALVYGWPRTNESGRSVRRSLSPTFARVYGLLSIAILAVATVLLTEDAAVLTGVFTLFGTIAGYLAGSKAEAVGGTAPADGGNPAADEAAEDDVASRNMPHIELN